MKRQSSAMLMAFLAATLYAVSIPLSKLLLSHVGVGAVSMAAFLYFGAGFGMLLTSRFPRHHPEKPRLTRRELPYTLGMILLDIAAPIFFMLGLTYAPSASASLLTNLEIVATSLLARLLFHERISAAMWIAVALITTSGILLSGGGSLSFSAGSLLIVAACCCWGLENNCTRMLSSKNACQIVIIKGIFSGLGSLAVALLSGESLPPLMPAIYTMLLGYISYGLSIFFYVKSQNDLGAARTSAYYAINPFIGSLLSLLLFREPLPSGYPAALLIMALGTLFTCADTSLLLHQHPHQHGSVEHSHFHLHLLGKGHQHSHIQNEPSA